MSGPIGGNVTRRRFLGALALGAAAAALLPRRRSAAESRRPRLRLKPLRRTDLHAPHDWAG